MVRLSAPPNPEEPIAWIQAPGDLAAWTWVSRLTCTSVAARGGFAGEAGSLARWLQPAPLLGHVGGLDLPPLAVSLLALLLRRGVGDLRSVGVDAMALDLCECCG